MITGKKLKLRRIELDIKAKDLADMLGIDNTYVSKIESGIHKVPKKIEDKWFKILKINNN